MKKFLGISLIVISIFVWGVYFLMQFPNFIQSTDLVMKQELKVLLISVSVISVLGIALGSFLVKRAKNN